MTVAEERCPEGKAPKARPQKGMDMGRHTNQSERSSSRFGERV